jgi:hypothetical protein
LVSSIFYFPFPHMSYFGDVVKREDIAKEAKEAQS